MHINGQDDNCMANSYDTVQTGSISQKSNYETISVSKFNSGMERHPRLKISTFIDIIFRFAVCCINKEIEKKNRRRRKQGGKKGKVKHKFTFIACKNKFISLGKKDLRASGVEQPMETHSGWIK